LSDRETTERPAWLQWLTTAVPPLTLIVALLVYFAWERRIAQAAALGFDASVLAEPSIPAFLIRSVGSLYLPLVILTVAALVVLWVDRRLRIRLDDWRKLRGLLWVSRLVPTVVVALLPVAAAVSLFGPLMQAYVVLATPFLLAAAVQAVRYGDSLRRAMYGRVTEPPHRANRGTSVAASLLTGLLTALLLFAGVDGFAQVVGRGLAQQVIDDPRHHTTPVLIYTIGDLQIGPTDATRVVLGMQGQEGYRYRYEDMRLAFVDGSLYFLISKGWGRSSGKIIVLKQDGIRVEFPRGGPPG
jgi:hypothetical protein